MAENTPVKRSRSIKRPRHRDTDTSSNKQINISESGVIPLEKMIELRSRGLSIHQIGKLLGCSGENVYQRLKKHIDDIDSIEGYRKHKSSILDLKEKLILDNLTPERLKEVNPYQAALMFGILYDKNRLEQGKSTQNVAYQDISDKLHDIDKQISAIESDTYDLTAVNKIFNEQSDRGDTGTDQEAREVEG